MTYSYALAFFAGLTGVFHCLGMCGGLAGGFFIGYGWQRNALPIIGYNSMRILGYTLLGVTGAALGKIIALMGIVGKLQGVVQMLGGILIVIIGIYLTGLFRNSAPCPAKTSCRSPAVVPFLDRKQAPGQLAPWIAGFLNGLVPCALVFSVALKAADSASLGQAALLMLAFGAGTLPTLLLITAGGSLIGCKTQGMLSRLSGFVVVLMGLWTFSEGWHFFSIMRGLVNW